VNARFENIGTLKPGASVKSAGVVVGRVKSITFNDQIYQAVLALELDGQYKFPSDSQFKIMTTGLLGDQFIGVEAGSDTEFLKEGQVVENTQSALVLEDLIGKFLYSKAQDAGAEKTAAP
jgi:phospholipid/cholesterol/gamma-HCH transport system substrate-binding protein